MIDFSKIIKEIYNKDMIWLDIQKDSITLEDNEKLIEDVYFPDFEPGYDEYYDMSILMIQLPGGSTKEINAIIYRINPMDDFCLVFEDCEELFDKDEVRLETYDFKCAKKMAERVIKDRFELELKYLQSMINRYLSD